MVKWFYYRFYDEDLNEVEKEDQLIFDDSFFVDIKQLFMHGLLYDKVVIAGDLELMLFSLETVKNAITRAAKSIDIFELLTAIVRPWNYCGTIEDEIIQMTKILTAALSYNDDKKPKVCYITFYMD